MNVPLCIFSRSDLKPLAEAMGKRIDLYYSGREGRSHKLRFALKWRRSHSPESEIRELCKLIQNLPPEAKDLWNSAKTRTFDIGIEAPGPGSYFWSAISDKTVKATSEINAQISITIYGPMKRPKATSKSRNASPNKQS
jgi:hypothetical protein